MEHTVCRTSLGARSPGVRACCVGRRASCTMQLTSRHRDTPCYLGDLLSCHTSASAQLLSLNPCSENATGKGQGLGSLQWGVYRGAESGSVSTELRRNPGQHRQEIRLSRLARESGDVLAAGQGGAGRPGPMQGSQRHRQRHTQRPANAGARLQRQLRTSASLNSGEFFWAWAWVPHPRMPRPWPARPTVDLNRSWRRLWETRRRVWRWPGPKQLPLTGQQSSWNRSHSLL